MDVSTILHYLTIKRMKRKIHSSIVTCHHLETKSTRSQKRRGEEKKRFWFLKITKLFFNDPFWSKHVSKSSHPSS